MDDEVRLVLILWGDLHCLVDQFIALLRWVLESCKGPWFACRDPPKRSKTYMLSCYRAGIYSMMPCPKSSPFSLEENKTSSKLHFSKKTKSLISFHEPLLKKAATCVFSRLPVIAWRPPCRCPTWRRTWRRWRRTCRWHGRSCARPSQQLGVMCPTGFRKKYRGG